MALGGGESRGAGTNSLVKIYANIFISFIGAGILGLPFAFKTSGLAEGCLIMSAVAIFSVKAMLMLVDCKYTIVNQNTPEVKQSLLNEKEAGEGQVPRESHDVTYADVGRHAAGVLGQRIVELALLVSQVGFCCAYLIFISENLSTYVPSVDKRLFLLVILPFQFMLTLYKELKRLAFFSLFAQISNILAFTVVFWFDMQHIHLLKEVDPVEFSGSGFPFFFAVAIYCFEGAGMVLSLEGSLSEKRRPHFKFYFTICITTVTLLYILFGALGYLSFGEETRSIITLNLPQGTGIDFAMIVKLCLCVALFFTYPLMMFPVTQIIERLMFPRRRPATDKESHGFSFYALRFALVATTGLVVVLVSSFADLMALVGATCCMLLAFILPGYFHLRLHRSQVTRSEMMLDCFIIFLGVMGAAVGTLDTLSRMAHRPEPVVLQPEGLGKVPVDPGGRIPGVGQLKEVGEVGSPLVVSQQGVAPGLGVEEGIELVTQAAQRLFSNLTQSFDDV